MPTALPIVRGISAALYPFTITFTAQTAISDGQNGSATRTIKGPPLVSLELPSPRLAQADKNTLKAFFTSAKGQFSDSAFGMSDLQATTYQPWDFLAFDDDEFMAVENSSTRYDISWKLSQTVPQNFGPGSPVPAYPRLVGFSPGKLPYAQKKRFQTIASKMPTGPKYSYAEFGGGLTNFPTDGLMSWDLAQTNLLETEVNTLLAHFLTNWGNALPFSFTDEQNASSATSVTAATGSQTFTTQAGLTYSAGDLVQIQSMSTGVLMNGTVTSYTGTTLVVNVTSIGGSGTETDWAISPTYPRVYYASPSLTIRWDRLNGATIKTSLVQTF